MALYGGPPHYVPPTFGGTDQGFQQQSEAGHWAYQNGRWAKRPVRRTPKRPKPPTLQHPYDPLAPISDDEQRRRATAAAQAQLGPILDQIRAAIEARSQSGQAAIRGYTGSLAGLLAQAAGQTKGAYDQAIGQQTQVNEGLANRLTSFGQNLGAQTAQKLDYAPASTQSNLAVGATNTATGTANANAAIGAADITRLISESAHGQEYQNKLPGIAALTGLQHAKDLEKQLNDELAQELADQSSKAQDTFATLYLHYQDQEYQKALARQSGQFKSAQAEADAKYRAQQIAYKKAQLAYKKANDKANRIQKAAALAEKRREANQRNATTRRGQDTSAANSAAGRNQNNANYYTGINPVTGKKVRIPKGYRYNNKGQLVKIPTSNSGHNSTTGIPH